MRILMSGKVRKDRTETEILAEKIKNKDPEAFDILYREYSEELYAYSMKRLKNTHDAEDAVSETFISVLNNIDSLRDNSKLRSWMYTIAKNEINKFFTKENVCRSRRFEVEEEEELERLANDHSDDTIMIPEDFAVNEERKQMLADIINSLSDVQKEAIYLFYYRDMPIKQISEQTGVSENTVKSRMTLAKGHIKRKVEKLRREGVMLSAVPISRIFGELGESVNIASAPIGPAAAVSGGVIGGISIAAVSTAILVGFSVISANKDNINVDNINGDVRITDSVSDSQSDSQSDSSYITTSRAELTVSQIVSDDSVITTEPSDTSVGDSVTVSPNEVPEDNSGNTDTQVVYIDIPDEPVNTESAGEEVSWEEIQLTDGNGNIVSNHLWYFDENVSGADYDSISYVEITHISVSDKEDAEIRYIIHSNSITAQKYRPYFEDISASKDYYPYNIYEENGETVAQFENIPRELIEYYTFEGSYYVDKIDENGVYYQNADGTLSVQEPFISPDGTFTIGKDVKYLNCKSYDKSDIKDFFSEYPQIVNLRVDEENPYYFAEENVLYYKPKAGSVCLVWASENTERSYYRIPDDVTDIVNSEVVKIKADHLDLGDNDWIIPAIDKLGADFENVRILSFSLGPDAKGNIKKEKTVEINLSLCLELEEIIVNNGEKDMEINLRVTNSPKLKSITIGDEVIVNSIDLYYYESEYDDQMPVLKVYLGSPAYYYAKGRNKKFIVLD